MAFLGGILHMSDTGSEYLDIDNFDIESNTHNTHTTPSFKLFTLHSISGFFMMFGLIGLACINQFDLSHTYAFLIAFIAGFAVMMLTAVILRSAMLFESSGSVFAINQTVGLIGTVYQRIPESGQGKIQIKVNNITREILAQSADKRAIESFTVIKVVNIIDHEVVEVIKLENK